MITKLDKETLGEFTKNKIIVVEVFGNHCGPCQRMMPIFEKFEEEFKDRATLGKIDMDENLQYLQEQFNIDAIPTFIFYKDGIEVDRVVGAIAEDSLKMRIEFLID